VVEPRNSRLPLVVVVGITGQAQCLNPGFLLCFLGKLDPISTVYIQALQTERRRKHFRKSYDSHTEG
jgi:hypothetical protein